MIVLQASAWDGRLVVWGESPTDKDRADRAASGSYGMLPPSPFDPGRSALAAALAEVDASLKVPAADLVEWTIWMPSTSRAPIASTPLVAEPPTGNRSIRVGSWKVFALALDEDQALTLLMAAMTDQATLAQGIVIGSTLAYWAHVARFVGSIVARQVYLPGFERERVRGLPAMPPPQPSRRSPPPPTLRTYEARWTPVLAGPDAARFAQLARVLPHAARALGPLKETWSPPQTPSADVLRPVVDRLVDHLVRTSQASPEPAIPAPKGRPKKAPAKPTFHSLHDQWLYALTSADPKIQGESNELDRLAEQVRTWRRPIDVAARAPYRLCFRLEEPEDESPIQAINAASIAKANGGTWTVRYLIQSNSDPSLIRPISDAWEATRSRAKPGRKEQDAAPPLPGREVLLSGLGQAATLCSRIEANLRTAKPTGHTLDASGAAEFLNRTASLLEQAGFGVLFPAWWSRKGTKLKLGAKAFIKAPKLKAKGMLGLDQLLNFQWEIALGGQKLTYKELQALARLKVPLVQIRGQWVQLSTEEIQQALAFWEAKAKGKVSGREAIKMALGMLGQQAPDDLEFEGVSADGWLGELISQLTGESAFDIFEASPGFKGMLRPYQARGFSWLAFLRQWGFGACLADDMGLGKTVQTLALLLRDWETMPEKDRRPTLLVCPMSVVGNWKKEAEKFAPGLPVAVHHGMDRVKSKSAFQKQMKTQGLVLTSYSLLHRDEELLGGIDWAAVVLDEAQNIKNPTTRQSQAARKLRAGAKIALTGTPVENHVGDLWSIMDFLNPGLLGNQAEFKRAFHVPIQVNKDEQAAKKLQALTSPFLLRRLKTDKSIISDLPLKNEMKVFCNLTKEQTTLYEAVVEETKDKLDNAEGIQYKGVVLSLLARLKQVCNHPAQFLGDNSAIPGRSGKLARLTEMLEEVLASGERALVFTQFAEMGEILRKHLQETFGREVLFLHGGTPKARRDEMVARFQAAEADGPRIFLLTVKAGGVGLTLTAANHVFHYDRWWNPAVENQATDRAFRIGQTKPVQVHKFLCVGTLEEKIDEMLESKAKVAGQVVGSGEDWLTKLSADEIKDVFQLRREAFQE